VGSESEVYDDLTIEYDAKDISRAGAGISSG